MGYSSELHIEMHNQRLAADGNYAAQYFDYWLEEVMLTGGDGEEGMTSDYRIDFRGYEEFRCDLCGEFSTSKFGHRECHDEEKAW